MSTGDKETKKNFRERRYQVVCDERKNDSLLLVSRDTRSNSIVSANTRRNRVGYATAGGAEIGKKPRKNLVKSLFLLEMKRVSYVYSVW